MPLLGRIAFGGPDLPPRHLRDLLQDQVDRAAPGSRIDWATYYFRDLALAEALMRASDRGVRVRLVIDERPRLETANGPVAALLSEHGLRGGFHLCCSRGRRETPGHLHAKIYAFSDPEIAWIGSFNPSGNIPEDAEVVAEIGDQDRGHNLLLGIERPRLIGALRGYIDRLIEPATVPVWARLNSYRHVSDGDTRLYFYPRITTLNVEPGIALLPRTGSVRAAISHLKKGPLVWSMARAATRGARIDLLVHDTTRRVSAKAFNILANAGVNIRRVANPDGLPMHAKFLLVEHHGRTTAWLGSYNFNTKSRLDNAEVLLSTTDAETVKALSRRFEQISAMS